MVQNFTKCVQNCFKSLDKFTTLLRIKTKLSTTPKGAAAVVPSPMEASVSGIAVAIRKAGISSLSPASTPAASFNTDIMKIIELLIKDKDNNQLEHASNGCIRIPHYKSKRGRELYDKASAGILLAQRYKLTQENYLKYL